MSDISDFTESDQTISDIEELLSLKSEEKEGSSEDEDSDYQPIDSIKSRETRKKDSRKRVRYITAPKPGNPDLRISTRNMTKLEYAKLIGKRADMISRGSPVHPKYQKVNTSDLLEIARRELEDLDIPFPILIYRPIDNPTTPMVFEVFNVRELTLPSEALTQYIDKYRAPNSWNVTER